MGARYPYYLLADSPRGPRKEAELTRTPPPDAPTHGDIRQGFVYERVPHITLKSIANNAEIDVIWEKWQAALEPLRAAAQRRARQDAGEEWEIPREAARRRGRPPQAQPHADMVGGAHRPAEGDRRLDRRAAPMSNISTTSPTRTTTRVRVAGPFTVESLSPHRVARRRRERRADRRARRRRGHAPPRGRRAGSRFRARWSSTTSGPPACSSSAQGRPHHASPRSTPWPGNFIGAEGRFIEGETAERRAAHPDRPRVRHRRARRTSSPPRARPPTRGFDVLIACAFNFDAHSSELDQLGRLPILKARMNPDLHMADELKNTGNGNLFVVFGEPDIDIARRRRRRDPREGQRRRRVRPQHRRDPLRRHRRHRLPGSSTPTTTRRASSSATPTSSAPTTPTRR